MITKKQVAESILGHLEIYSANEINPLSFNFAFSKILEQGQKADTVFAKISLE
jgi:hypothetical protein